MVVSSLNGFGDGAETHQRVIGAAVRLAPHIGDREAEIDQMVVGEREGCVVERLQLGERQGLCTDIEAETDGNLVKRYRSIIRLLGGRRVGRHGNGR